MCGRYVSADDAAIERAWNIIRAPNPFNIVYNAAPTMTLPVVRLHAAQHELRAMQWGLIPSWWSKPEPPRSTINARVEEAASKPMWRTAVKQSRCLVPSLGWYEWQVQGPGRAKQPFFIHLPGGALMHFAGLWSSWIPKGGEPVETFAILTRDAAGDMAAIHNRMPVVLSHEAYAVWLDPALEDGVAAAALARDASIMDFETYPVSTYVNTPRHQGEECNKPVDLQP